MRFPYRPFKLYNPLRNACNLTRRTNPRDRTPYHWTHCYAVVPFVLAGFVGVECYNNNNNNETILLNMRQGKDGTTNYLRKVKDNGMEYMRKSKDSTMNCLRKVGRKLAEGESDEEMCVR